MLRTLLLALVAVSFLACQNGETTDTEGDMGQFADDQEFQDSHEEPGEIEFDGLGEMFEFNTPDGETARAYRITTDEPTQKFLFVIHEWWGLNDHIKAEAERLFADLKEEVTVLAIDMYDGKVATTREQAGEFMQAVSEDRANAIIDGALAYAGKDGEVATIGWCFGGGWSLKASIAAGERGAGCVMYYGMPVETADKLQPLEADVLGIFATKDEWINEEVVNNFEALCAATGTDLEVHWYDADHAFANPSQPSYVEEAAKEANAEALSFLENHLRVNE